MNPGRVLVTGASGFVGQALVAALRDAAVPLTLASRGDAFGRTRSEASVCASALSQATEPREVAVGSIGANTDWAGALAGVDAVVHLAGHVHIAPERAAHEAHLFDEVNHLGSVGLFDAAQRAGVRVFVFLSTVNVLGTATLPGRPFTDATEPNPTTPYARSKHLAETALRARASGGPTRLVILRPPLIVGPGVKGNLARLLRLASLPVPLPLGGLDNRRTLLSRDNLVAAIARVLAAQAGAPSGTWLVGDRSPVSTSDIVRALRDGMGRPGRLWPIPLRLGRAALRTIGRGGLDQRLFGDLELDTTGFRRAFGFDDVVDTLTTLRATAALR